MLDFLREAREVFDGFASRFSSFTTFTGKTIRAISSVVISLAVFLFFVISLPGGSMNPQQIVELLVYQVAFLQIQLDVHARLLINNGQFSKERLEAEVTDT